MNSFTLQLRFRVALLTLASVAAVSPLAAITPAELAQKLQEDAAPKLIDVRPTHEFEIAHIPGALNIPVDVLAHRQLPPFGDVVVIADGRGNIDGAAAAQILRSRLTNARVDVLEGGFAAWESGPRPTTQRAGFSREALPAINYDQLLAAKESDLVLVDLRAPAAERAQASAASGKSSTAQVAAAAGVDPVTRLAQKIPGARVAGDPFAVSSGSDKQKSSGSERATAAAQGPAATSGDVPPLLVLIDDNDGRAQEVARKLLATGNRRFVILTGGAEAARLEGQSLIERSGGAVSIEGGSKP